MNRGDVYDAPTPGGRRPCVIVTRDRAIPYFANVCVVLVTSVVRELPTEVPLGPDEGLDRASVANCDNVFTLPKAVLARRRGALGAAAVGRLDNALRIALALD